MCFEATKKNKTDFELLLTISAAVLYLVTTSNVERSNSLSSTSASSSDITISLQQQQPTLLDSSRTSASKHEEGDASMVTDAGGTKIGDGSDSGERRRRC
ncbi:hypothetical protein ACOSP7_001332 [Xanthoceras sorbifolium]